MPGNLENPCPDGRENRLHDPDYAVVERVHCARSFGFAYAARDQWLDVARLDLDVHDGPVADDIERLGEGRNARAVGERKFLELRCRQFGDRLPRGLLRMPGVNDGIVVNDDNPVPRRVHIQLYAIGSQLDGALECGERVLGMGLVRTPVGDPLGGVVASTCGQVFLQVVAL